ncbi:hypothetical protein OWT79_10630 [Bacteroides fragilis]|nr:hypothetical protein [Bacteroides fragilis]
MVAKTYSGFTVKFGEFPDLLFTHSNDGDEFCDATGFIESRGCTDSHSVDDFIEVCKPWVNAVCANYSLELDRITVVAPSGHILIDSSLALLFVSYIDTEFSVYVYERIAELLISGIILSDTTLVLMAKDRLTKEVLLNLIDNE